MNLQKVTLIWHWLERCGFACGLWPIHNLLYLKEYGTCKRKQCSLLFFIVQISLYINIYWRTAMKSYFEVVSQYWNFRIAFICTTNQETLTVKTSNIIFSLSYNKKTSFSHHLSTLILIQEYCTWSLTSKMLILKVPTMK